MKQIDEVITHYQEKRSATLPLLHLIKEDIGYLPKETEEWVADKLELEPINVFEVTTFYPMFRRKPTGRRLIRVCRTLSCALFGGHKTCETLRQEFNTDLNEVSPDGDVTIEYVECLASCGTGPVLMVDDELHEKVDCAKAKQIADQIKAEPKES